jgi:hypothetical protein
MIASRVSLSQSRHPLTGDDGVLFILLSPLQTGT